MSKDTIPHRFPIDQVMLALPECLLTGPAEARGTLTYLLSYLIPKLLMGAVPTLQTGKLGLGREGEFGTIGQLRRGSARAPL